MEEKLLTSLSRSFSLLETLDDDEGDRRDASDEGADEKSNLRISQPKYSQLLKELDFSHARMVNNTPMLFFRSQIRPLSPRLPYQGRRH